MSRRPRRHRPAGLLCALLALSLVGTACGLKSEQKDALQQGAASGGGGVGVSGVAGDAGTGGVTGTDGTTTTGGAGGTSGTGVTGGAITGGATGGGGSSTSGGTTAGGSTTGGSTGGTAAGPAGSSKCQATGGDSTGISKSTINIGVHAPQTGTGAPLPPSFKDGVALYWNNPAHMVCGRKVVIDFQDDKYTPSTARDVCGPMSRRDFIVVGGAGTDQIQSCATMPAIANNGVPYFSAGVTTNGLTALKHYFALSLTYAQQSDLVLRNAQQQKLGMKKWAVITSRTDNFKDARASMESVLKKAGVPFTDIQVDATNDSGLQSRAGQTGTQIATGGYDTVFVDTSPGYFVYMTGTASKQGFSGTYTGPGITMTEVTVANLVCTGTGGVVKANFLAPYPGIDRASDEFKKAANGKYDDIYWSLWGLSQGLEQILNSLPSLTRQSVLSSLPNGSFANGVYPPTKFGGGHFGGTGAFSQILNCNKTEPNGQNQPGAWDTLGGVLLK